MTAGLRHLQRLVVWAMLAPVLMLSLVSPAVMPARQADGTLTLVLCSADGPAEVLFDLATGLPVDQAPDRDHDACAWACGQMAAECPVHPGVLSAALTFRRADPPPAARLPRGIAAAHLPPATGPPAAA